MNVGDRVAYTARFLRSIGGDFATAERRGELISWDERTAIVQWDDAPSPQRVLRVNIAKVGSVRFGDVHAKPERDFVCNYPACSCEQLCRATGREVGRQ